MLGSIALLIMRAFALFILFMNHILLDLKEYFEHHLKDKVFIFDTYKQGSIVVKCKSYNFAHLIGKEKSTNLSISSMHAKKYYNSLGQKSQQNIRNQNLESIFSLIDKERYDNNQLTEDEFFILNKVTYFIELFESLEKSNGKQLRIYNKKIGDDFDADFLHLQILDNLNHIGYIGIIGSDKNDYHWFNSLYIDSSDSKKGTPINIKKLTILDENQYDECLIERLYSSRRFIKNNQKNTIHNNKKLFKLDKKTVNKINKQLNNGFNLKKGEGKASQYHLMKNNDIIIRDFQNTEFEKSINGVIIWINDNYPASKCN